MRKIFFVLTFLTALCVTAQTEVNSFLSGSNEGATYYLPHTRIDITVEAVCISSTPGEFNRYAERYLRINNAIQEATEQWSINNITVGEAGVPAAGKMYTIRLNNSSASNIVLNNEGIIASINREPAEAMTPLLSSTSVGTRPDARQYMTEEMLQATSTAKLAELVAKEIYVVRESKLAITRGTAENMPRDGQAMQLVLDELSKQEQAYMELFTGYSDTIVHTFTFSIMPEAENCDTTRAVLFRFSRKMGVLSSDNLAGEPVYYDLKDLKTVEVPSAEELAERRTLKKEGICYNVPGRARIDIYTRGRNFISKEISLAQLGTTEILAKNLFNRNNKTKVLFNTATGGIISIVKED